jgi:hypothetical protein
MKASRVSKGLLLGLALLLATAAFAASKGSLQVNDAVTVNGTQLAAGDYTVKWDGNGPNVQLNILHGKQVVATTSARLVTLDHSVDGDSAVVRTNADGSKSLAAIRFGGKKYALELGDASAGGEMGSSR